MKGEMIVIEGIEGAGKSTAIACVKKTLMSLGVEKIVLTREPGGTPIAESLRSILKHGMQDELPTLQTEVLLMYAARSQLLNSVIWPAINKGEWVVADRHDLSSFTYQGAGRGADLKVINALSTFCVQGFEPSLTLYLDVNPTLSMSRVTKRGEKDRFEKEKTDFFMRVRDAYLAYAKEDSTIVTIDASQSLDAVSDNIENEIKKWYESR